MKVQELLFISGSSKKWDYVKIAPSMRRRNRLLHQIQYDVTEWNNLFNSEKDSSCGNNLVPGLPIMWFLYSYSNQWNQVQTVKKKWLELLEAIIITCKTEIFGIVGCSWFHSNQLSMCSWFQDKFLSEQIWYMSSFRMQFPRQNHFIKRFSFLQLF